MWMFRRGSFLLALGLCGHAAIAGFIPGSIQYQGRLVDENGLVSDPATLEFRVFPGPSGGTALFTETQSVTVVDGLYSVALGSLNTSSGGLVRVLQNVTNQPWLELVVNGQTLAPREPMASVAFAFNSATSWNIDGNRGVLSNQHFLGTLDNVPLELRVNNQRALGLYPKVVSPNLIGGHPNNAVGSGTFGAVIAGGGFFFSPNSATGHYSFIGAGFSNRVNGYGGGVMGGANNEAAAEFSVIAGGTSNLAAGAGSAIAGGVENRAQRLRATIGGGENNVVSGEFSTVSGGFGNNVTRDGATIGGGEENAVRADYGVIAGGQLNVVTGGAAVILGGLQNVAGGANTVIGGGSFNEAHGEGSAILGGNNNIAAGLGSIVAGGDNQNAEGSRSFIGGGILNTATGSLTVIGGGQGNLAGGEGAIVAGGLNNRAEGRYAIAAGGEENEASGDYSFAAGRAAKALHEGSFVWSDTSSSNVNSTSSNQWTVRSSGGVTFYSDPASSIGVVLLPGVSGWNATSDRNLKENIAPVDGTEILEQLNAMPISRWNFKGQDRESVQIGPMAQDFQAAFDLGGSDTVINSINADGVALAAIQALYREMLRIQSENEALRERIQRIEHQVR